MMHGGYRSKHAILHTAAADVGTGAEMAPDSMADGSFAAWTVQITGLTTGTITWQGTQDGSTWVGFLMAPTTTETKALTATANGIYRGDVRGFKKVRANITALSSGTPTIRGTLTVI